ncbi:MAG: SDR family oxidoreductase [Microcella sp.]|uniref:SDR family oxidoreductase n=1 Tax=Microcella sp. TaxID=1913979 RepID=UPI0024CAD87B|nr:SDR family oxidoreductase [Microcella sp.]UYN83446.1 MAG: SDR family oxidoreductase [Microcella sp.]
MAGHHDSAPGAFVTGASNGIGEAVVDLLLDEGCTVTGVDRTMPAARIDAAFTPLGIDLTDPEAQRAAALEAAARSGGQLQSVVTHAFMGSATPLSELTLAGWNELLDLNLTAAMLTVQSCLPVLADHGSIVITSSIAGRRYSSVMGPHYTVARYGLIGLGRHLAAELAGTGVRVNVVCPGPPDTPALWQVTTAEQRERIAAATPTRRLAAPRDVAEAVVFLLGDGAKHMHGAVIDVNGGLA